MSVLLFGVSHRSAPVRVLEQLSAGRDDRTKIVSELLRSPLVSEAMMVATCNRVEVYAVVEAFHGGLSAIGTALSEFSGLSLGDLTSHAYVRYADAAAEHLFAVASGLDSAVLGEQQVLGQVRAAYADAESVGSVGRVLHELAQRALSVGKRVHSETGIDGVGASVVSVALDMADRALTAEGADRDGTALAGRTAVVVGAGSMGALTVKHLVRAGIGAVRVVNRTPAAAVRLAERVNDAGVDARAYGLDGLVTALAGADVAVCCTGAVSPVVTLADVHCALADGDRGRRLILCDLGMPRDVEAAVAGLPGVDVIDMDRVQRDPSARAARADSEAARALVAGELATYLAGQRMAEVTPTVTALRQRAADVVTAELMRLDNRLPSLEATARDEVARTVRRVVDKLLHAPTVRVKQLASAPGGDTYAEALRELFELDPTTVDAVATVGELSGFEGMNTAVTGTEPTGAGASGMVVPGSGTHDGALRAAE